MKRVAGILYEMDTIVSRACYDDWMICGEYYPVIDTTSVWYPSNLATSHDEGRFATHLVPKKVTAMRW